MASNLAPKILVFKADAAISKGMAVKFGTDDEHVAKCSAATDQAIGLAQGDAASAEDLIEVAVNGGGGKALAGGTITRGDFVASDSSGNLVATTTGNDNVVGQAMASAVVSDIFPVLVNCFNH
jgi:hypothetical protein